MTTALAIPDPRSQPVPSGWCESVAAPAILATQEWAQLDEYEGRLRAFASYIASFEGDSLEFEKALRIVEKRRGDLLGEPEPGKRTDLQPLTCMEEVEASAATINRWRMIARNWEELWPVVLAATRRSDVTQAALLRLVGGESHPPFRCRRLREIAELILERAEGPEDGFYRVPVTPLDRLRGCLEEGEA